MWSGVIPRLSFSPTPLLCCISLFVTYNVMGSLMTSGHFQLLEPPLAWSETSVSQLCQSPLLEQEGGMTFSSATFLPSPVSPGREVRDVPASFISYQ